MPCSPPTFKVSKFDNYKGKGDPKYHIREFLSACIEVVYNDTYLMHLFPHSLIGQSMERFKCLPLGVKSFGELVEKFVTQFSYNIEHRVSMMTL